MGFTGASSSRFIAELCARGYACYALDFRGHGRSGTVNNGRLSWSALTDDCAGGGDGVGVAQVSCSGTRAAWHALAMAEARRPGTFRSIYAFEPIFVLSSQDAPGLDVSPDSPLMASTAYMVKSGVPRRSRFSSR